MIKITRGEFGMYLFGLLGMVFIIFGFKEESVMNTTTIFGMISILWAFILDYGYRLNKLEKENKK